MVDENCFIVAAEILGEITQRSISWGCVVLFCAGQDRGRFFGSPAVAVTAPSAEQEEGGKTDAWLVALSDHEVKSVPVQRCGAAVQHCAHCVAMQVNKQYTL